MRYLGAKEAIPTVQAQIVLLLAVLALIFLAYFSWALKNEEQQMATFFQDRDNQFVSHFNQLLGHARQHHVTAWFDAVS